MLEKLIDNYIETCPRKSE